ncbi:MAG: chorismate-binding protein, partial [Candidatus Marinimicrobia bacterium]|nr:chorismate-binding protein [Candidatus Neomarinimicrobiota bacterium]
MNTTTYKEFKKLCQTKPKSESGLIIPIYRKVLADLITPVYAYLKIRNSSDYSFLLESVEGEERFARYSFLGQGPSELLTLSNNRVTHTLSGAVNEDTGNGIDQLREILSKYDPVDLPELPPFTGGAVGYISYDAVRQFVNLNGSSRQDSQTNQPPELHFAFYRTIMAFDHFKHQAILISNVFLDSNELKSMNETVLKEKYESAVKSINSLEAIIDKPIEHKPVPIKHDDYKESFDKKSYLEAVVKAKNYIVEGDAFQIVLSRREEINNHPEPFEVYRALRTINPSPYLFYLEMDGQTITGSSPEMLVKVENRKVQVRPIAGTRPRGSTRAEDEALETELRKDEKERAEHAMLVDLGRNDLGKVSKYGT